MAYSILFKQCGSDHMTRGRSRAVDRIVVHFTATLASARNNATYFARNEGQGASAHYFVDDITPEIYQSVAEGDTAWHAGDWQMNCRAIGIEVVSAGEDFSATEVEKLGWLVRKLMARYGIGASGVIRHYDVTGKKCPAPWVDAPGEWEKFRTVLRGGDPLTQDQFDAMLENYLSRRGAREASGWALPYLQEAAAAGVMAGTEGGIDRPQAFATREELAAVAAALCRGQGR